MSHEPRKGVFKGAMGLPNSWEVQQASDERTGYSSRTLFYCAVASIIIIISVMIFPAFQRVQMPTETREALGNIRFLAQDLRMYAADNDDRLPMSANWMDATENYSNDHSLFRAPALGRSQDGESNGSYGLAFRHSLAGVDVAAIPLPDQTVMIFDSVNLRWNATGELNLLPNPPRYRRDNVGVNVVGFVDGHAGVVSSLVDGVK